jgi:hypothetical protein
MRMRLTCGELTGHEEDEVHVPHGSGLPPNSLLLLIRPRRPEVAEPAHVAGVVAPLHVGVDNSMRVVQVELS